jgi:hypothetical protein
MICRSAPHPTGFVYVMAWQSVPFPSAVADLVLVRPMKRSVFTYIVLAFAPFAAADTYRGYQSNVGDKIFAFEVSEQHLSRTPKWRPTEAEPPLSPRRATRLAESLLPHLVTNPGAWKTRRVSLQQIDRTDVWIYMIDLVGPPFPKTKELVYFGGDAPEISVPVLMDGTVPRPMISRSRR